MVNNNLLSKNNKQFEDCLTSIQKIPNSVDTLHAEESGGDPTTQKSEPTGIDSHGIGTYRPSNS